MITLYHCMSARSFRPLWILEELGIPYDLIVLPFPPRALRTSYLTLNPLGTVPLMIDGATLMTESSAICQYLCALSAPNALNVETSEADFGRFLNYLHFGEATLTFPQTLVLRYTHFEVGQRKQPQVAVDYERWFLSRLRTLEPLLTNQAYLCSGRFTAADVSVGYALFLAETLGLKEKFTPAVRAYWERLQQRNGYARARRAEYSAALDQGVSTQLAPLIRP